jgi:hypothetical protein
LRDLGEKSSSKSKLNSITKTEKAEPEMALLFLGHRGLSFGLI